MKPDSVSEREVQASTRLAEAVEAQLGNEVFAALLPAACEMPFRRQSKASGVLDLEECSLQHMARLERGKRDPDGQKAVVPIARRKQLDPSGQEKHCQHVCDRCSHVIARRRPALPEYDGQALHLDELPDGPRGPRDLRLYSRPTLYCVLTNRG